MSKLAIAEVQFLVLRGLIVQISQALHQIHQISVNAAGLLNAFASGIGAGGTLTTGKIDDTAGGNNVLGELLIAHDVERAHRV